MRRRFVPRSVILVLVGSLLAVAAHAQGDLVAPSSSSGVVGALAPGASARGTLAGVAGAIAYHTYVVDVAPGAARLVLVLDADVDLDLAAKPGAEIANYDDPVRGGDWVARDVATTNPTVLAVDRPTAGRWYVDVFHQLGPTVVGHYRLTVAVESATATVKGERTELAPDPNGRWVDEATGQRYGEHEMPGAAAAGYTLVRVGYLDAQVAELDEQLYLWDPGTGIATYTSALGLVTHAGCASDFWVHPDALRALPETLGGSVQVVRMPYAIGDRTFDAIRLQTTTAKGHTVYVYDLASRLMLFHGARTVGGPVEVRPQDEHQTFGEGSTQLVSLWIADARDVAIPWAGAAPPPWVASVQRLAYEGTATTYTRTTVPLQLPLTHEVTIDRRGTGWLHGWTRTVQATLPGLPPTEGWSVGATGTASLGGWWIAPQGLAGLRAGQTIDAVAALGTTTSVTAADGRRVTLSEVGPAHRIDAT